MIGVPHPHDTHYGSMGLVYVHTFTIKNQPNVGKYTIHGSYGTVRYGCSETRKTPPVSGSVKVFLGGSCRCCQELLLFQQSELQGDPLQQMDAGANSCLV